MRGDRRGEELLEEVEVGDQIVLTIQKKKKQIKYVNIR